MNKIIFFGNGPLADYALPVLRNSAEIIFHARGKDDLATVAELKRQHPEALAYSPHSASLLNPTSWSFLSPKASSISTPHSYLSSVALHLSNPLSSPATLISPIQS